MGVTSGQPRGGEGQAPWWPRAARDRVTASVPLDELISDERAKLGSALDGAPTVPAVSLAVHVRAAPAEGKAHLEVCAARDRPEGRPRDGFCDVAATCPPRARHV